MSAHLNVADQSSPCTVQNISAGGLFIQTTDVLPPGMSVAVNLARPGWNTVLRLTGRVVWALAEKTAAKKNTIPGMRIKFDPLSKEATASLTELLTSLGAPVSTPIPTAPPQSTATPVPSERPVTRGPTHTQPVSMRELLGDAQTKREGPPRPLLQPRASAPKPASTRPSGPRGGRLNKVATAVRPDDVTLVAKAAELPPEMRLGSPQLETPRLLVQVQGLLMQMGELQSTIDARDRELISLRQELMMKQAELEKADRERKAAELAIQRLSMQLASRR